MEPGARAEGVAVHSEAVNHYTAMHDAFIIFLTAVAAPMLAPALPTAPQVPRGHAYAVLPQGLPWFSGYVQF